MVGQMHEKISHKQTNKWTKKLYGWYLWKYWMGNIKGSPNRDHKTSILLMMISLLLCLTLKKLQLIVISIFTRCRKLNIFLRFITQSCFAVPKDIRLHSTHYFPMKVPRKFKLQQMTINHSSGVDFRLYELL